MLAGELQTRVMLRPWKSKAFENIFNLELKGLPQRVEAMFWEFLCTTVGSFVSWIICLWLCVLRVLANVILLQSYLSKAWQQLPFVFPVKSSVRWISGESNSSDAPSRFVTDTAPGSSLRYRVTFKQPLRKPNAFAVAIA